MTLGELELDQVRHGGKGSKAGSGFLRLGAVWAQPDSRCGVRKTGRMSEYLVRTADGEWPAGQLDRNDHQRNERLSLPQALLVNEASRGRRGGGQ